MRTISQLDIHVKSKLRLSPVGEAHVWPSSLGHHVVALSQSTASIRGAHAPSRVVEDAPSANISHPLTHFLVQLQAIGSLAKTQTALTSADAGHLTDAFESFPLFQTGYEDGDEIREDEIDMWAEAIRTAAEILRRNGFLDIAKSEIRAPTVEDFVPGTVRPAKVNSKVKTAYQPNLRRIKNIQPFGKVLSGPLS